MAGNNLMDNLRVDIEISPDLQNLIDNAGDLGPEAIKLGLRKVTKEMSKETKEKVRSLGLVRSGQLAKSIRGSTTKNKSYVGTKLWYAHFLEGGTAPHTIKAKRGKYLWWRGLKPPGVKQVNHPGIKAHKFSEGTFNKMQSSGEINSLFAQGVTAAMERLQNG